MARRNRPTQLFASLLALVVMLTVATTTAGANKKSSDDPARRARAARWRHQPIPGGFRTRIPKLVTADSAAEQRRAYRGLLRAAIRDAQAPGRIAADHEGDDFGFTLPAGDLTGDGKDDAVQVFDSKIQGVRGTNGATLWTRTFQGWGGYLGGGRLDGVAGEDLLVLEVQEQDLNVGWRWTIRIVGLSGITGNALWTRTYENVWTFGGVGSTGLHADVDFVLPWSRGEISGDAARDLLVARFDVAEVASNVADVSSLAAIFETVSGANGQVVASYPGTGRGGGVPDAVVVPTFTGDAADDVVTASVARSEGTRSVNLAAYPGKGGAPAWRRDLTLYATPSMEGLRLNGDTTGDVLIQANFGTVPTTVAVNGANGASLWTQLGLWGAWIEPAGDANGDGGQDLIAITDASSGYVGGPLAASVKGAGLRIPKLPGHEEVSGPYGCYGYSYGYCPPPVPTPCDGATYGTTGVATHYGYGYGGGGCPAVEIALLRGSNAQSLWSEFSWGWAEPVGDATGDGVGDVLLDGFEVDESEEAFVPRNALLSGTSGEPSWTRPPTEDGYLTGLGGDVDGDGGADLLELRFTEVDAYRPVAGSDGHPLWNQLADTGGWLMTLDTARLTGTGADLIESTIDPHSWTTTGTARAGTDGEILWSR